MGLKLGLKKPRINKLFLASLVISIAMVGYGGYHFKNQMATAQETVQIPVPGRDLPVYYEITPGDLALKDIPAGSAGSDTLTNANDIVGKITTAPIYKGEKINRNRLTGVNILEGYDFVSVNVDLARAGGAVPGNRVDVYKLVLDSESGITQREPVARDAIVLNVWDGQGNSIYSDQSEGITDKAVQALSSTKPPAVIRLAVKPSETGQVVDGAATGKTNIVLAVKNGKEGGVNAANGTEKVVNQSEGADNGGGQAGTDNGDSQDS
ncbi:MAG: hypothetical protein FH756_00355 [Firmicutes bacterium]|nr:hypothetical protein [Bacillota bacterium]